MAIDYATIMGQKVNQLNATAEDGKTDWTENDLMSAINSEVGSFEDWYTNYGAFENLQDYSSQQPTTTNMSVASNSNPNAQGWTNDLMDWGMPAYQSAYQGAADLPAQIDQWMADAKNGQRVTGDQVSDILNLVGNQRAGSGIMGGTEYDNALAGYLSELSKTINDNKTSIDLTGSQMKADAIYGMPSLAYPAISSGISLYGTNAADQQNWAALAANLLNSKY